MRIKRFWTWLKIVLKTMTLSTSMLSRILKRNLVPKSETTTLGIPGLKWSLEGALKKPDQSERMPSERSLKSAWQGQQPGLNNRTSRRGWWNWRENGNLVVVSREGPVGLHLRNPVRLQRKQDHPRHHQVKSLDQRREKRPRSRGWQSCWASGSNI